MIFQNRIEAGLLLAEKLKKYQSGTGVVLAIPRGGVPVAYAVAKELGLPIELILTKKSVTLPIRNMPLAPPA